MTNIRQTAIPQRQVIAPKTEIKTPETAESTAKQVTTESGDQPGVINTQVYTPTAPKTSSGPRKAPDNNGSNNGDSSTTDSTNAGNTTDSTNAGNTTGTTTPTNPVIITILANSATTPNVQNIPTTTDGWDWNDYVTFSSQVGPNTEKQVDIVNSQNDEYSKVAWSGIAALINGTLWWLVDGLRGWFGGDVNR